VLNGLHVFCALAGSRVRFVRFADNEQSPFPCLQLGCRLVAEVQKTM